jgi:hypothetical protein
LQTKVSLHTVRDSDQRVKVRPALQLRPIQYVELEAGFQNGPLGSPSSSAGCHRISWEWYLGESSRDVCGTIPDNNVITDDDFG